MLKVLDCTLRDGGYYNQWNFPAETVKAYLNGLGHSRVDVVEMGLRLVPRKKFLGPFAYCQDHFLNSLPIPEGVMVGVMINADDYLDREGQASPEIDRAFVDARHSKVDLVRVASHFKHVKQIRKGLARLGQLGYRVGLNLMQIGIQTPETIVETVKVISQWDEVEVLYFADSLGNMQQSEVVETIKLMSSVCKKPIGIHAHNNMGQALANTMEALKHGVQWLDATISGMGRGAGNTKMEMLLTELAAMGRGRYRADALYSLVSEHFGPLQEKFQWGENLYYYLAAKYQIHPTFVQEMLSNPLYSKQQVLMALEVLKRENSLSYNVSRLNQALGGEGGGAKGTWSGKKWCRDRDVLVLANGPGLREHREGVESFIRAKRPLVVALNIDHQLDPALIDCYAVSNQTRLLLDHQRYAQLKRPIFMPKDGLASELVDKMKNVEILNYGCKVERGRLQVEEYGCTIPHNLVAPYVFCLADCGGAKRILLAGFDGFGAHDPRQREMEEVLRLFQVERSGGKSPSPELLAVTPSSYSVSASSIYSPEV